MGKFLVVLLIFKLISRRQTSELSNMVKTRQQFKIAFRKRKSKLLKEKPLDGGVDDREEKSLVFYDKTQGMI